MTSVTRAPGSLTVGPLRPVILQLAAPAVAMMACHFCFNLIDSIWVGRLIGPAALAAVSTAGFYVWVLLSLGEMVEVGLIAVAARRHGEGRPDLAARAAGAAVLYALGAGTAASLLGFALTGDLFRLMTVPHEVAALGAHYLDTWLLGGPPGVRLFAIEATFRAAGGTRTPSPLPAAGLVGQNLGANQEARARQAVRMSVRYCLTVTVTTAAAFLTIPRSLVALFTSDPAVIADGSLYLRVIAFAQIGQTFEIILEGALAGAGYTFWPQTVSTGLTLLRLPLAAWWSATIGLLGIWLALSVTAIARGVAM